MKYRWKVWSAVGAIFLAFLAGAFFLVSTQPPRAIVDIAATSEQHESDPWAAYAAARAKAAAEDMALRKPRDLSEEEQRLDDKYFEAAPAAAPPTAEDPLPHPTRQVASTEPGPRQSLDVLQPKLYRARAYVPSAPVPADSVANGTAAANAEDLQSEPPVDN